MITNADQDSDSLYVTNQPDVVACAKMCHENYPTIVNLIPKEKNTYDGSLRSFAKVDNALGASQRSIGESSNLAQICLTYTYNFPEEQKYQDYVCILSVVAQAAIDNAKRRYAIDIMKTIRDIRNDMDIDIHRLPLFWQSIKDKNDLRQLNDKQKQEMKKQKNAERTEFRKIKKRVKEIQTAIDNEEFIPPEDYEYLRWAKKYEEVSPYNSKLICPMNSVYHMKVKATIESTETYEMDKFFKQYELKESRKKCRKVEEIIQKYSLQLNKYNSGQEMDNDEYLLFRSDFDNMIEDIKRVYISSNYLGLMSWLINRSFIITTQAKNRADASVSTLKKNRSLLLKTLYTVNKEAFLMCFSGNMG